MRFSHVLALLVGGAVVGLVVVAGRPVGDVPCTVVAPRAPLDPRVDRLLARLEQLEERLARSAPTPEEKASASASAAASGEHAPVASPGVATATLRLHAKAISTDLTRAVGAVAAWDSVAERTRDPEAKAEAWFEQGEVYRRLEDYGKAAESWQRVVDTVGLRSERGRTAAYQLGWAKAHLQETHTAYATFRELAHAPGLSKPMESAVRLQVAAFAKATGDVDAARREYERYVHDYSHDEAEHYRNLAKIAARQLRDLG